MGRAGFHLIFPDVVPIKGGMKNPDTTGRPSPLPCVLAASVAFLMALVALAHSHQQARALRLLEREHAQLVEALEAGAFTPALDPLEAARAAARAAGGRGVVR